MPIATGERLYGASEYREIWADGFVDIIQPDITQCGGIFETKKIASTAEIYSIMVAPHNVGGVVSDGVMLNANNYYPPEEMDSEDKLERKKYEYKK